MILPLALAALFAAAPAQADAVPPVAPVNVADRTGSPPMGSAISYQGPPETRIRNMADYIEAVADPERGVYIRGYTGQWYYARVRGACPRLTRTASLRFNPSPGGDFDRDSSIRADGWRCMIASVVASDAPPRRRRH